jgi:hypothetical protein
MSFSPLEAREESNPCCIYLVPPKSLQLLANHGMVLQQQLLPATIAQRCRAFSRADDVGQQHRDQSTSLLRPLASPPQEISSIAHRTPEHHSGKFICRRKAL